MIFHPVTLALALFSCSFALGQGLLQLEGEQCVGTFYDQSRLEKVSNQAVTALLGGNSFGPGGGGMPLTFVTRQVNQITAADDPSKCLAERHRVRELVGGIPVFAADFVVTVDSCSDKRSKGTNTLMSVNPSFVRQTDGYMVSSVSVPTGYSALRSKGDAVKMVANLYQIADEKVTTLELGVYPTERQDYRAWIGTVLVETNPGDPRLYQVVVDDESEEIILQCQISGLREKERRKRTLRRRAQFEKEDLHEIEQQLENADGNKALEGCQSCTDPNSIRVKWDRSKLVECDAKTLYMNNEGRKSLCFAGIDRMNRTYVAPAAVPDLYFNGTLNCNSGYYCELLAMPDCKDALHDIHWGVVNFMKYAKEHLGVHGGLVKDGDNPVPVLARAHYDRLYCNAFYVPGDHTVTFGDCDCELFSPLVSTDVIVHELVHGYTSESSNLIYFFESGGLNEAYSDIMACAIEHTINDSLDTPDFTVGESLVVGAALGRAFLRHMEFPSEDGKSIDTYCDYEVGMNVHYSSGFLNRAYVNAVRSCEETGCGTRAECAVLMADTFMYTNMETLASGSRFKDAAEQTCRDVDDWYVAFQPSTQCTLGQMRESVLAGFSSVGVVMSQRDCHAHISCQKSCYWARTTAALGNFYALGKRICSAVFGNFS